MPADSGKSELEELQDWIKQQVDDAVHELMNTGAVKSILVEAKPAWVFPHSVLIGRIRDQAHAGGFDWFICGDAPTTHAHGSVAGTPRDAARHFALKWQLDAARKGESGNTLANQAEFLYELVETPELWESQ